MCAYIHTYIIFDNFACWLHSKNAFGPGNVHYVDVFLALAPFLSCSSLTFSLTLVCQLPFCSQSNVFDIMSPSTHSHKHILKAVAAIATHIHTDTRTSRSVGATLTLQLSLSVLVCVCSFFCFSPCLKLLSAAVCFCCRAQRDVFDRAQVICAPVNLP